MNTAQSKHINFDENIRKKQFAQNERDFMYYSNFSFVSFQFFVLTRWSSGNHGERSFIQRAEDAILAIASQTKPNKSNGEQVIYIMLRNIWHAREPALLIFAKVLALLPGRLQFISQQMAFFASPM